MKSRIQQISQKTQWIFSAPLHRCCQEIFVLAVFSTRHIPLFLSDLVSLAARVLPSSNGQSARLLFLSGVRSLHHLERPLQSLSLVQGHLMEGVFMASCCKENSCQHCTRYIVEELTNIYAAIADNVVVCYSYGRLIPVSPF